MKKILAILLTMAMILTLVPSFAMVVSADGSVFSGGDGSAQTPYQIVTADDLAQLAADVNAGNDYAGKYFKLMADLDLSAYANWTPIGGREADIGFAGHFDGQGHKVFHLTIHNDQGNLGLFGFLKYGSSVRNLGVEAISVEHAGVEEPSPGNTGVGVLAGYNKGTITNCYATGDVRGSNLYIGGLVGQDRIGSIINCYATVDVTGGNIAAVGGLVGSGGGRAITNCYATGNVTGRDGAFIGGLVGKTNFGCEITNCYAAGDAAGGNDAYVGGLIGANAYILTSCYATGDVIGGNNTPVGGLIGMGNISSIIINCYWNTDAAQVRDGSDQSPKWGSGNRFDSASLIGKTSAELRKQSTYIPAGTGEGEWDFSNVWMILEDVTYPLLQSNPQLGAGGSSAHLTNLFQFEVVSSRLDTDDAKWTADVILYAEEATSASVILAVYDQGTGRLLHAKIYDNQQIPTKISGETFFMEDITQTSGVICKLFVWNHFCTISPLDRKRWVEY